MEIKSTTYGVKDLVRFCLYAFFLIASPQPDIFAQTPIKKYIVKSGRMYIELSRNISEASLDSFIIQYNLHDLALKQFMKTNSPDSLQKLGWKIDINNETSFTISKSLMAFNDLINPGDKIRFAEKHPTFADLFPAVSSNILYGFNSFRNKAPFAIIDSVVRFFLRNNTKARQVMLAGSFNNWAPNALPMSKTDSGWIALVRLGPGKYWYKFIIDGRWTVDNDNLQRENDGLGNINSVFFRTNFLFTLNSFLNAKKVYLAGSFNGWRSKDLPMVKTETGWQLPLYLANGTHTYKFAVDNEWYTDEKNPNQLPDGHNGFNSVIRIGKPYIFTLKGYESAKKVVLSGSFNGWRQDELLMNRTATGWELPYTLGPGNYEYNFLIDGKRIVDPNNPVTLNNQNSYLIIEPNYTFRLHAFSKAKTVFLAGDFNNWTPNTLIMKREGDDWVFTVYLSPGKHLYKFIVDGNWIIDPGNKLWEQNEYGTGNSVIWIESK